MIILHLKLTLITDDTIEVRYFTDNPNRYQSQSMMLSEIKDLVNLAEEYYPENTEDDHRSIKSYLTIGRRLFNWLDGADQLLAGKISDRMILAIATGERFAHLPWEILADGSGFLVDRGIVPVRWCGGETTLSIDENVPRPYELNLLLMATSPESGNSVLSYEQEEAQIIQATERAGLQLVVEESGCLTELKTLVSDYGKTHFDVFHLTGHATIMQDTPVFVMETDEGNAHLAKASEIVAAFEQFPTVVFLSGCKSGQSAKRGGVSSMAELLVGGGAKAVLGWGKSVLDSEATLAAKTLYGELAAGTDLIRAVSATCKTMRQQNCQDWHLLRIFVGDRLPGALVMPKNRRKPQPRMKFAETEFLDPGTRSVKVASRRTFVGRRRVLQQCLRSLRWDFEKVGVWLHGMGGLGKSSVAARLCDRFPTFERVVIVGSLSEPRLLDALTRKLRSSEIREKLQDRHDSLLFRLRDAFETCDERLLIVLDDFEFNLEPTGERYQRKSEVAEVLRDLEDAITESGREHRLIVTCRYVIEGLKRYWVQPLAGMDAVETRKIRNHLEVEKLIAKVQGEEQSCLLAWLDRVTEVADGNPEWQSPILAKLRT